MSFLNSFFIHFFSQKVGEDQFGNKYYIGKSKNYLGHNRRYVIYKGIAEPSKVPPLWHAWLHFLSDNVPAHEQNLKWQHEHLPNLTGTKFSYTPKGSNNLRNDVASDYNKWQPKQGKI